MDSVPDLREQELALHYPPTQDNLLGRQDQYVIHQCRGDVISFDIPERIVLRDIYSLYAESLLNGRSVGEALEAIPVEGTASIKRIQLAVVRDADMSHLRGEQTYQGFPIPYIPTSDARSDCKI